MNSSIRFWLRGPTLLAAIAGPCFGNIVAQNDRSGSDQHPGKPPEISNPQVQKPVSPSVQSGTEKLPPAPPWTPGEPVQNVPDLKRSEPKK
jgi:hypothetical protein